MSKTAKIEKPHYTFGVPVGPEFNWFAWRPVRLWYGRVAWLKVVKCQKIVKRGLLDGPDWEFWSYRDRDHA